METQRFTTTYNGKTYKVILPVIDGRAVVWVRVVRELADGTTVDAFLSHRQHKAESAVRRLFAKEINAHIERCK